MRCPFCSKLKDRVLDSRLTEEGVAIRRRRQCMICKRKYTTYERIDELKIYVIKKNGKREPFDRNKILSGVMLACKKLTVPTQDIENIVNRIERHIYDNYDKEVKANYIGDIVMRELKELDPVAYVRFASYYRAFKDATDFVEEVKKLPKKHSKK